MGPMKDGQGQGYAISWSGRHTAAVSAELLHSLTHSPQVPFLVIFRDQADARAAYAAGVQRATASLSASGIPAAGRRLKLEGRGAVLDALQAVSTRSQSQVQPLVNQLRADGHIAQSKAFYVINALAVTGNTQAVQALARHTAVASIIPDRIVTLDPVRPAADSTGAGTMAVEWNISQIGAPQVWALGIDGTGAVVGALDTGVEYSHPALERKFRGYDPANPSSPRVEGNWFDAVNGQNGLPYDDNQHGTHVTGTMVGSDPGNVNQIGAAPGARWIAAKGFNNTGSAQSSWLLAAGEWLLAPRDSRGVTHPEWAPDVITNSWGGGPGIDEWYRPMVANWRAANIFPAFAAGNSGPGDGTVASPGNYPEACAVGAVDNRNQVAAFSSRGPSPYGEVKPEVCAPGVSVRSSSPGGGYRTLSGTSMATPHVSGTVALMVAAKPSLTVDEIESLLMETAAPLTDSQYPTAPNNGYGRGLIAALDAVSAATVGRGTVAGRVVGPGSDLEPPVIAHTPVTSVYAGQSITLSAVVSDNQGVAAVDLLVRLGGAAADTVIPMNRKSGDVTRGTYEGRIAASLVQTAGLSYRIRARDASDNEAVNGPNVVQVKPGITVGYRQDFETAADGFSTGGANNPWQWGQPAYPPAYSGKKVYGTNLSGTGYDNGTNAYLLMPPIDLTRVSQARLRFKQFYDTQLNFDFADVYLSTDGGDHWNRVFRQTGSSSAWVNGDVDLTPYAGQGIQVMFNLFSDSAITKRGWFLDDIAILGPDGNPPGVPANVAATPTELGSSKLTWTAPPDDDIAGYRVMRSATPGGGYVEVGRTSLTTFFDNGAPAGQPSYYVVAATDLWGATGPNSAEVSATAQDVRKLFFDNMENGQGGWTVSPDRTWELGTPTSGPGFAFSGTRVWATRLAGNYGDNANTWVMSPPVSLAGCQTASLQFAQWYQTEWSYDNCDVEVSTDDGVHWTRLVRYSGFANGWQEPVLALNAYAGQTVRIRFRLSSDYANNYPGWYIDDVRITCKAVAGSSLEPANAPPAAKGLSEAPPALSGSLVAALPVMATGSQVAGLPIEATVTILETGRSVPTDPGTGAYSLRHPVGTWTAAARAYGFQPARQTVTVTENQTTLANFMLQPVPHGFIEGRVLHGQTGQPLAGARVGVSEDSRVAPATTDNQGHYRLEVLEGTYTLWVRKAEFYPSQARVMVAGDSTATADAQLQPFVGAPGGQFVYDDGTLENAYAWPTAGDGWTVRLSVDPAVGAVLLTTAQFLLSDTRWPTPGGTDFQAAVYDSDGPGGAPGTVLVGPVAVTGRRDGQWTEVDLRGASLVVTRDCYVAYLQKGAYPNCPGLGADQNGPWQDRSWQVQSGVWSPVSQAEGNRLIRALALTPVGAPQILSPAPETYTAGASLTVTGSSRTGATVAVFNNGAEAGRAEVASDHFTVPVTLVRGGNSLTAAAVTSNGTGPFSQPVVVHLDQQAPELTVDTPADGTRTNREAVTVSGHAADDSGVPAVMVNDQAAALAGDGSFNFRLALAQGANQVTVAAADQAGNRTVITRTVLADWTPPALTNLHPAADVTLAPGESVTIGFDSESGGQASYAIGGDEPVPEAETAPGHYEAVYTARADHRFTGQPVFLRLRDAFGNLAEATAPGKVSVQAAIAPPVITSPADGSYRRDAALTVQGTAPAGAAVTVLINGEAAARVGAVAGTFAAAMALPAGRNVLTAVAETSGQRSEPSAPVTVYLDTEPPQVDLTAPVEGALLSREVVTVAGRAADNLALAEVRINGMAVAVAPDGSFRIRLALDPGRNEIAVVAADRAGNSTTVTRTVTAGLPGPALRNLDPCHDVVLAPGQTVTLGFDADPGGQARYALVVADPTGIWDVGAAMTEVRPGRYEAVYRAPTDATFAGALVLFRLQDAEGSVSLEAAHGRLTVQSA